MDSVVGGVESGEMVDLEPRMHMMAALSYDTAVGVV